MSAVPRSSETAAEPRPASPTGHIHQTPADAVEERVVLKVFIEDQTFLIERPAGLDKVFDHPQVRSAYDADEYIPYWTDLWAAARMLAKVIVREPWTGTPEVLEIGCGLGLGGIAALSRGLPVTFSDCDATAVEFAAGNARRNGYTNFKSLPLDLRSPPAGVQYPVIIGSDLMYEDRLVDPLVGFLKSCLAPSGLALITDPDRTAAKRFRWAAERAGLLAELIPMRVGEPGGERIKGTLYRIKHQESPMEN